MPANCTYPLLYFCHFFPSFFSSIRSYISTLFLYSSVLHLPHCGLYWRFEVSSQCWLQQFGCFIFGHHLFHYVQLRTLYAVFQPLFCCFLENFSLLMFVQHIIYMVYSPYCSIHLVRQNKRLRLCY